MANSVQNDVVTDSPSPNGFIGILSLLARLETVAIKPEHLLENSTERCELKTERFDFDDRTYLTEAISVEKLAHKHSVMNQFPKCRQQTEERYLPFEPSVPSFSFPRFYFSTTWAPRAPR